MSEIMAVQSMAEEYAKFKGYMTETRVPFILNTNSSDIDVLGYNPKTRKTIIIECKAWGSPEDYPSYSHCQKWFKEEFKEILSKWKVFEKSEGNKWKLSKLKEIWFVVPGSCDDKTKIEQSISGEIGVQVKIIPIHELLLEILLKVKTDKGIRRKRYANSALEFCRWLLRAHEHGKISLIDVDIALNGERKSYDLIKENYIRDSIRTIMKNAKSRGADVNTRISSIKSLLKIKNGTILEIIESGKKMGFNLNYNRVNVGLWTWQRLGIVNINQEKGYFINECFKEELRKQIDKIKIGEIENEKR